MKLDNYLDLMIDEKIDNITDGPVAIDGVSSLIIQIYEDLKPKTKGKFHKLLRKMVLLPGLFVVGKMTNIPLQ